MSSFFVVNIRARDILSANQIIENTETIVSASGEFELGFFSPGSSKNLYLSIRYKKAGGIIVWVANTETPLTDASGTLAFSSKGTLEIINGTNSTIWSSNSSKSLINPVAQLLDTGNLVIRTENDHDLGHFFWQSFDFPGNTFLPGMKLGKNLATGLDWSYNSWKSNDDPSHGNFQIKLGISGYPQLILWNGSDKYIRLGPWNGVTWSAIPNSGPNNIFFDKFIFQEEEIYYEYEPIYDSMLIRIALEPDGRIIRYSWTNQGNKWEPTIFLQADYCDEYARCGAFGSCNVNSLCRCLDGFQPHNVEVWHSLNFSDGCIPKTQLNCSNRDDFVLQLKTKLPDTKGSSYNFNMNLEECKKKCQENCSCIAYANTNITGTGSGCLLWFGDLYDIRDQEQSLHDFYVRVVASGSGSTTSSSTRRIILVVLFPLISISTVVLGFYLRHLCKTRKKRKTEGLLCVQQYPEDRPNMSSVLVMLTSKVSLPQPKQPGFFTERKLDEAYPSSSFRLTDAVKIPPQITVRAMSSDSGYSSQVK
ncbi:hypothetical protein DCAR_0309808 [Daucus carota subsp. sativus]|uniref:Uncharacterized protein n=1 Tax=Daucus carota subsp. sativus TaxID=79200 RepID=A0A165ZEF7_DAUCS|nr:hypothetical protein DCAR_0309808 [Daucus carota subsp. sativus]